MSPATDGPAATAREYLASALAEADDEQVRFDIRQALQLLEGYRESAVEPTPEQAPEP